MSTPQEGQPPTTGGDNPGKHHEHESLWQKVLGRIRTLNPIIREGEEDLDEPRAAGQPPFTVRSTGATLESGDQTDESSASNVGDQHKRSPKRTKSLKLRHALPKTIPTTGWKGVLWKFPFKQLYARKGWVWLAQPSIRERYNTNLVKLWERRHVQKIVAFCNGKGGSAKSAFCCWMVVLWAYAIKQDMTAVDMNAGSGSTASRLGISKEKGTKRVKFLTIHIRDYLSRYRKGELRTNSSFIDNVDWHRDTGVSVITSDRGTTKMIGLPLMMAGLHNIFEHKHSVFCDCGNQLDASGNLASVKMAHTIVFTANVHMADSEDDLGNTMQVYADEYRLPKKVQNGIITIVGVRIWWQLLRNRKTQRKLREEYAERYSDPELGIEISPDQIFIIPYNRYMANKSGKKVVGLDKMPKRMLAAFSDALIAVIDAETVEAEMEMVDHVNLKEEIDAHPLPEIENPDNETQTPASAGAKTSTSGYVFRATPSTKEN